jgi:hypothetical protein
VREAIPTIPEPVDLDPLREEIAAVREAIPPAPDLSGYAKTDDIETLRSDLSTVRDAIPEIPEPRDWSPEIKEVESRATEAVEAMREVVNKAVDNVTERLARHPGVFPRLKAWADGVHYAGDVVVHEGATWQARRDTGKPPPHDDWSCIAAKGDKGETGRCFTVRGTYSAEEEYQALDVVILDGSSFVAKHDDPGPCPGDGWQLAASRGGRGKQGDPGKAVHGKPGEPVVGADVSDDGLLTLTNGDGSTVHVDLYPLFAKVAK